jgi:uncharacterized delta-60 repeat protein
VLIGGDGFLANSNTCFRLNADGSRDTSFTNRFSSFSTTWVNSLVVQPDGKILVGGGFTSINGIGRNSIARLNPNGSVDTSFNPSTGASFSIFRLLLLDNGQIMAAGSFTTYAGVGRNRIVRINANGSIDLSFDPGKGADNTIYDIAPLEGGRLAVGGPFRKFGGLPRYNFAVLEPSGQVARRIRFENFAADSSLNFGLQVEPGVPFELLNSSNLIHWQVLYSNRLYQSFTNLVLPKPAPEPQFFRILQLP